ncbi:Predicted house-cleaning noncanonical NTP pyrophosphatase, all-alpha NTP-PPase (MazG) superfamily [Halomicrobium zhouii]|uniref:Predicted house-cleaning noncanonical NTP pyrophosphatase, all-alpha NTP-PPase (MazG) superfamily n=1 Tax=Halomicrobium zhouii TaxID=767519 RepID=A0A1I6L4W4_9EURY|nr:nucleoside triphosphate pyrophosphohydrolase [Halomicrobium zhouii]SFR98509.1 Predicted house-cleaning noncanonical NTP pyrophosphatase, all-alpha NTP-PPase (MazG) superfamily [Halomicrobium zhouii]
MRETYDKLVRDGIPELIRADGDEPVTRVVEGEAYRERLQDKLDEEVAEFHESGDVEELADVLAVVDALAEACGSSSTELADIRRAKAAERGEFEEGVVLESVRRSSGDE